MFDFTAFELMSILTNIVSAEYCENVSVHFIDKEISLYGNAKNGYYGDKASVSQRIRSKNRKLRQVCSCTAKVKRDCACRCCEDIKRYIAQQRANESELEEKISTLQRILDALQECLEVKASNENVDLAYGDQFLKF